LGVEAASETAGLRIIVISGWGHYGPWRVRNDERYHQPLWGDFKT